VTIGLIQHSRRTAPWLGRRGRRVATVQRMVGSTEARALHAEHPPIDLHADTLTWSRWLGYDLRARHEPPLWRAAFAGHIDLPRLREGGIGAQFFGLVSLPVTRRMRGLSRVVNEQIDVLIETSARSRGELRLVRTADEVEACRREGVIGALLGIEGAHALEGDPARIEAFARRGVRYLGFLHFTANEAGYPAYGPGRRDGDGLTPFGFELVRRCEGAGVLVDLAHINRRGFLDACSVAIKPPIVSHTGVLGAYEHWRNIDDEQLRAVARKGGVVGVIFFPRYLGGDGLEPVVKHLVHILNVVGEDTPALGSDWDGMIVPTRELRDPRGLPLLTDALIRARIPERTIGKILRGNVMRVLAEG
jgi:membrane dipeptidase